MSRWTRAQPEYVEGLTKAGVVVASWLTEDKLARQGQEPQIQGSIGEWRCGKCGREFKAKYIGQSCPKCGSSKTSPK